MNDYCADLHSKLVYCQEHAPFGCTQVEAGNCYVSTLPYVGATVLCCATCGVEVWNAEKIAAGEVSNG
jgi:hypothetical protein